MAQKTGADAVYKFVKLACGTLARYSPKLRAFISASVVSGAITSGEATTAILFLDGLNAACDIFKKLSDANNVG